MIVAGRVALFGCEASQRAGLKQVSLLGLRRTVLGSKKEAFEGRWLKSGHRWAEKALEWLRTELFRHQLYLNSIRERYVAAAYVPAAIRNSV